MGREGLRPAVLLSDSLIVLLGGGIVLPAVCEVSPLWCAAVGHGSAPGRWGTPACRLPPDAGGCAGGHDGADPPGIPQRPQRRPRLPCGTGEGGRRPATHRPHHERGTRAVRILPGAVAHPSAGPDPPGAPPESVRGPVADRLPRRRAWAGAADRRRDAATTDA